MGGRTSEDSEGGVRDAVSFSTGVRGRSRGRLKVFWHFTNSRSPLLHRRQNAGLQTVGLSTMFSGRAAVDPLHRWSRALASPKCAIDYD